MSDRIVGYPSNLTTVSASPIGGVRVTFAPWELDWEFFNLIAVDSSHYLANTTTAASVAIIGKGGAENLGYYFDIDQVFPSANWNTGNRITPQRQAAIAQYATFAAAIAAMANHDYLLAWYSSTTNRRHWFAGASMNNKAGSVWGMLSKCKIYLCSGASYALDMQGNLLAQNQQVVVKNIRLCSNTRVFSGYMYNPNAGQIGAGVLVDRAKFHGTGSISYAAYIYESNAGTCEFRNCVFYGAIQAVTMRRANAGAIRFCVCFHNYNGFVMNSNTGRNNFSLFNYADYGGTAGCQYCADTDGTLPVAAGNLRNQDPRTFRTFFDTASPGQNKFPLDPRIYRSSVLAGAGIAIAGLTTDGDGVTRPDPPAIGPYEPRNVCYAPAAELICSLHKRGVLP